MSRQVRREASRWLLRLQSEAVSAEDHAAFKAWYRADPTHAEAFDALAEAVGRMRQSQGRIGEAPEPRAAVSYALTEAVNHLRQLWKRIGEGSASSEAEADSRVAFRGKYHELDPENAATEASGQEDLDYSQFARATPPRLHLFGHLPDLSGMRRGDVILVRPKKEPVSPASLFKHISEVLGGSVAWYIQRAQAQDRDKPHSLWVHAGLYLGDDMILEAVTPRVSIGQFSRYSPTHYIRVRRYPNLTEDEAVSVCLIGASWVGIKYDVAGVRGLAKALFNMRTPRARLVKNAFICSELVQMAFLYGASRDVGHVRGVRIPTPADLSFTPTLEDQQIPWRRLAK
jgi:hypothetical protein